MASNLSPLSLATKESCSTLIVRTLCRSSPLMRYLEWCVELVTRNHVRRGARVGMGEREEGKYTPVIGLSFISNARSLLASCHSLVSVFGGGAATKKRVHLSTHTGRRGGGESHAPNCLRVKKSTPATPTRANVLRRILKLSPGWLVGVRGP